MLTSHSYELIQSHSCSSSTLIFTHTRTLTQSLTHPCTDALSTFSLTHSHVGTFTRTPTAKHSHSCSLTLMLIHCHQLPCTQAYTTHMLPLTHWSTFPHLFDVLSAFFHQTRSSPASAYCPPLLTPPLTHSPMLTLTPAPPTHTLTRHTQLFPRDRSTDPVAPFVSLAVVHHPHTLFKTRTPQHVPFQTGMFPLNLTSESSQAVNVLQKQAHCPWLTHPGPSLAEGPFYLHEHLHRAGDGTCRPGLGVCEANSRG